MTKDTTTIRVKEDTKQMLQTFGNFGDNYDDCIQRLYSEYIRQDKEIKQLKTKKQNKKV